MQCLPSSFNNRAVERHRRTNTEEKKMSNESKEDITEKPQIHEARKRRTAKLQDAITTKKNSMRNNGKNTFHGNKL